MSELLEAVQKTDQAYVDRREQEKIRYEELLGKRGNYESGGNFENLPEIKRASGEVRAFANLLMASRRAL